MVLGVAAYAPDTCQHFLSPDCGAGETEDTPFCEAKMSWGFAAECGLKAEVTGSRGFALPELQTVGLGDTGLPIVNLPSTP